MSYNVNKVDKAIDKVKEVLNEVMKENNFNIKQIKRLVDGAVEEIENSKNHVDEITAILSDNE